ncbi:MULTISPECIES: WecB/TagA/CpsF family glycosyltransferase [Bacillaceae]|jgi:N-acetylglucosaminyldiphosphoundecaprenol N-acetyl-beta-D-mannosaminyltransferase|uniref:N-acetylglucosaminyldiphosphoundecaprenol N-acetyl-beta-D-mannosaminyltransferase n=1 Tax=Peribacillus castrilensis TaxID=2897690 RepID=A0AAW9N952_9BACI|nr:MULTISPECIES: WecB/TagA/CpsF family glycosyltransferase [Bacillaceae]KOR81045.1 acetylglucosaminyldiphospho-UDP acetyl-beta-D-mannosaminyltransferase [Bacillus sp. FJAT-21352]MEC0271734.1 WecB/TagA/CpsF family glycosyltransferase [Peribacillus castrilensis]MBT2615071.1 WecB/TagA/CpsF family glycosyltransferase [Bacillus sp. ISL-78]MBT2627688.1 WecB/TagA/CpsF family glycosyltransferase [Bacillus sp. ISL-101]MBT2716918.1 WecB/TagA/CpsF family glycosyltransferase [Bacillus sp. ISL-57]
MTEKFVEILTIPFIDSNMDEFMNGMIYPRLMNQEKTFVVTANPEIVEYANEHQDYKDIIISADYITPDGVGIIMASKWLNQPLQERITGFDLMNELFRVADEKALKVYLLGAEESVIEAAALKVKELYPGLELVGYNHGYIDIKDDTLPKSIAELEPDIILTALGFPRQEKWVSRHYALFNKGLFMGVGGSFDVLAGKVNRAPVFWQKMRLEWLYRLIQQPSRWKRMLALPRFVLKVRRLRKTVQRS